jgi:hypothetical protein
VTGRKRSGGGNEDLTPEAGRVTDDLLEDSTTYQLILRRGAERETRRLLIRLGTRRFGPPPASTADAFTAVTDRDRLERMILAALDAAGWDDLLPTP